MKDEVSNLMEALNMHFPGSNQPVASMLLQVKASGSVREVMSSGDSRASEGVDLRRTAFLLVNKEDKIKGYQGED